MPNDVVIHVRWDDPDGDRFAKATKAKAHKAGDGAGTEFSGTFTGRVKKGAEKATEDIANELNRSQKKIADIGEKIGAETGEGFERGARGGFAKGGKAADTELSRVSKRANKAFDAKMFAGLSVGLPGAAAIGAAGTVAALGLIPAAMAGASVFILKQNEQLRGSFNTLGQNVLADARDMAQVMVGPLQGAASQLQTSWDRLKPAAREAFRAAAPEVETLVGTVTDFAENAMPGLVTAIKASHAPLLGLRTFAGQAGAGLTDFFTNAAKGGEGARQGLTVFGGTVQLLEGRLGSLFANLANGSSGPLTQFHVIVDQATGTLVDLTSKGSAAISFFSGFGSAAGGSLTALRGVLSVLSALPQGVSQFSGSLTAAALIGNKFGLDLGGQFEGLGKKVKGAGNDLAGVEKYAAKAGTAVGALAAGALNPTTLAVAALGAGLMILGQQQEAAANEAAGHAARERDLASALRESKGAVDGNVRALAAKKLSEYQVSDGTRNLIADTQKLAGDEGVQLLTDGYLGNVDAQKQLVAQLRQTATEHTHTISGIEALGTQFDHFHNTLDGNTGALDDTGFAAKQLADIIDASGGDFQKAMEQAKAMGLAVQAGVKPMNALEAATEGLKSAASGSEERLSALVDVLNILEGRNASFEESIQAGNDALRGMEDGLKKGLDKAEGFGKALLNADGSINTFSKNGSGLQDLATGLETSFAKAGSTIDEMVRKGMPFDQAVKKVNDSLGQQRDRFVAIAEKMGLTKQQAQQLADKYGLLPQEITTRITADTKQGEDAIRALPELAANTHGAVPISADIDKATGKVNTVVQYADGSTGVITIDGNKDPATGKVMVAVQYANGAKSFMTIDAFNQAAKDRTIEAKRMADGTVAYILVDAKADAANSAIDWAARARTATIYVQTQYSGPNTVTPTGPRRAVAKGGLVGYAHGGTVESVPRFAGGGQSMVDVRPGGLLSGPGTGTSDSILALTSRGPAALSNGEFIVRASQTRKHLALLEAINNGTDGFAAGGSEALYAPSGGVSSARSGAGSARGAAPSGLGGVPVLEVRSSGNPLDDFIAELIRRYVRVKGGGDVQKTFGR